MAAACMDKTVCLYDAHDQESTAPRNCGSKEMQVGKLYTASFYPSSPWLLGCGGSENHVALWDMSSDQTILRRFAEKVDGEEYLPEDDTDETVGQAISGESNIQQQQSKTRSKKKRGKQKKKVHRKNK